MQDFATVVRIYRKERGWSQSELAVKWSYSFETISAWERGKRFPGRVELVRLAKLLGMELEGVAAIVAVRKGGQGENVSPRQRRQEVSVPSMPFADGRLFWSLHLGIQDDGLHCVISCPLAGGGSWEIALDPQIDFQDIQQVYRVVSEHVMLKGMRPESTGDGDLSHVVRFGLVS